MKGESPRKEMIAMKLRSTMAATVVVGAALALGACGRDDNSSGGGAAPATSATGSTTSATTTTSSTSTSTSTGTDTSY